jgi:hypothetical protein
MLFYWLSDICMGKYQWDVSFFTGVLPLKVDFGLINSSGLKALPHLSHWSPYALKLLHFGHSPEI